MLGLYMWHDHPAVLKQRSVIDGRDAPCHTKLIQLINHAGGHNAHILFRFPLGGFSVRESTLEVMRR